MFFFSFSFLFLFFLFLVLTLSVCVCLSHQAMAGFGLSMYDVAERRAIVARPLLDASKIEIKRIKKAYKDYLDEEPKPDPAVELDFQEKIQEAEKISGEHKEILLPHLYNDNITVYVYNLCSTNFDQMCTSG